MLHWKLWLPPALLTLAGVVALAAGGSLAFKSIWLLARGQSVEAQVTKVAVQQGRDLRGNSETRYTATIVFQDWGKPVTIVRRWTTRAGEVCTSPCYRQGDVLQVRYLPEDPEGARIGTVFDFYGLPAMLLLSGAIVTIWGVALLRDFRKRPAFEGTPTWR